MTDGLAWAFDQEGGAPEGVAGGGGTLAVIRFLSCS